jgi:hypothetical protein
MALSPTLPLFGYFNGRLSCRYDTGFRQGVAVSAAE